MYNPRLRCASPRTLTTSLGSDPVDGVISLSLASNLTTKSDGGATGLECDTGLWVDVGDGELDGGVVLGGDESVWRAGRARARSGTNV